MEFLFNTLKVTRVEKVDYKDIPYATKIFVNGDWIGMHKNAEYVVANLKALRRKKTISHEISIVRDILNKEIKIFSDAGRIIRPLFIMENNELKIKKHHIELLKMGKLNFNDLLTEGLVEFLDVEEEETCMIAMRPPSTNP